jgi:hypothetical protein
MLPDVALLEIFEFYLDSGYDDNLYPYYDPNLKVKFMAWCALVRVCQTWRNIVFGSPLRLRLQLYCVPHRTSVRKAIVAWPALPIIVEGNCSEIRDNEKWVDNIVAVFEHSDRICRLNLLEIRSWQLEKVSAAMQQPFPALTRLSFYCKDETAPVVPASSLGGSAPQLQFLSLERIPFPGLPKLLLSATRLVELFLSDIPHSGYIPPEAMVPCLSVLTRLEILHIGFKSPQSRPNRNSRRPPPPTRTLLPVLTRLELKAVSEYLEDLVARIDAPLLNLLEITFFHQLILDTPQLTQFISRTPNFMTPDEVDGVYLEFSNGIARVSIRSPFELSLRMSCRPSDWQLLFLTQMCNLSFLQGLIPAVEHLYIQDLPIHSVSEPPWQDDIEGSQWLELLRPFTAVNELYISKKFVPRIAPALQELVGERATEALPALRTLFLRETLSSGPVQEAIQQFVTARQLSNHPIAISQWEGGRKYYEYSYETDEEEDRSSYETDEEEDGFSYDTEEEVDGSSYETDEEADESSYEIDDD